MSTPSPATSGVGESSDEMNLAEMQNILKLQIQAMTLMNQKQEEPRQALAMKHTKVPKGRYEMNSSEFRIFSKDVADYQHLTKLTDERVVIQIRLNMDSTLKQVIDTNYPDWNRLTVPDAVAAIGSIVKKTSNPVVFQQEFHNLKQHEHENIKEFITRLKVLAVDCEFICPHDETHDLTEYHIIHQVRCGISDKKLQQELLQRHTSIDILNY